MDLTIKWNEENYNEFSEYLKSFTDEEYCKFNSKIINDDTVNYIGIRTPQLRKIAKEIARNDYKGFIKHNKHELYEERALHGFIIGYAKVDYNTLINMLKDFVPYLSNWALVDTTVTTKFKQIENNKNEFLKEVIKFTKSDNPWEIRLGLMLLLSVYLDEKHIDKVLKISEMIIIM